MHESGELKIRRAVLSDADIIAEFAMQLIDQHISYDSLRFSRIADHEGMSRYYGERAAADNAAVLVAEDDGNVVGFAYLEFEPILYAELAVRAAWLHDLFLNESARGRGTGKLLMDAVRGEARRLGANKVLLSVAAQNADGLAFFEHSGFTPTVHEMMLVID